MSKKAASTTTKKPSSTARTKVVAETVSTAQEASVQEKTPVEEKMSTEAEKAFTAPEVKSTHSPSSRVFDVFLIDSGWNTAVGNAVRDNLPNFASYLKGQRFYVMSNAQSTEFIGRHTSLVGADPILIVLDRKAAEQKNSKGFGFRLCLGHMQNPEAAVSMMKWAIQLTMSANGGEMAQMVRECGHRQSIQGTIELIGESSAHLLEFAPV